MIMKTCEEVEVHFHRLFSESSRVVERERKAENGMGF